MRVAGAIRQAAERLSRTSDTARLDAELLMAGALGVTRSDLLLRHMADAVPQGYAVLVERRAAHEPVAYILGMQEFYGREFAVKPGVLIPRGDSEVLIEAALGLDPMPRRVLDMGTGSGALLLTYLAERPGATGIGIDASPIAIEVAGGNAIDLGLEADWAFHLRSWRDHGWADDLGIFDLILCNPPYVEDDAPLEPIVAAFEPPEALFAGPEGLWEYEIVIPQLDFLLESGGTAILEIGHKQGDAVSAIAANHGFSCEIRLDLGGRPRAALLTRGLGKAASNV